MKHTPVASLRSFSRREFVTTLAVGAATVALAPRARAAPAGRKPRILLREALQYENIGDSGRVPGTIRLFYEHLPEAEVTLWPWSLHEHERKLWQRTFPRLRIVEGELNANGRAPNADLKEAWETANVFVSPSKNARTFTPWAATGRAYGFFGAAFDPLTDRRTRPDGATLAELREELGRLKFGEFERKFGSRALYEQAAFIFCRDTLSLQFLQQEKLKPGRLEFGPEGAFAVAVRDEARAEAWLRRHGLKPEEYICVVPRLRYTPFYRVNNTARSESDYALDALNAATTDRDHAPVRDMLVAWVRRTGGRVIACPEMTYQIQTAREQFVDPLPDDVKRHVVWRDTFWGAEEAVSIYARARAVISVECHSPILALAAGTPTLHVRQPVDTVKAEMFRDIGVGDWLFETTKTSGEELGAALQRIHDDLPAARAKVRQVMAGVADRQRSMTRAIGEAVAARG